MERVFKQIRKQKLCSRLPIDFEPFKVLAKDGPLSPAFKEFLLATTDIFIYSYLLITKINSHETCELTMHFSYSVHDLGSI